MKRALTRAATGPEFTWRAGHEFKARLPTPKHATTNSQIQGGSEDPPLQPRNWVPFESWRLGVGSWTGFWRL